MCKYVIPFYYVFISLSSHQSIHRILFLLLLLLLLPPIFFLLPVVFPQTLIEDAEDKLAETRREPSPSTQKLTQISCLGRFKETCLASMLETLILGPLNETSKMNSDSMASYAGITAFSFLLKDLFTV